MREPIGIVAFVVAAVVFLAAWLLSSLIAFAEATGSPYSATFEFRCIARPMPKNVLTDALAGTYGEKFQRQTVINPGTVAELWANPRTGTWTIIGIHPSGGACIGATGQGWKPVDEGEPL